MKPTIRDIAAKAGTSIATVSYVLNNSPDHHISEATKERILSAVKELNYVPDLSAKNFKTKKKHLIGYIGPAVESYFWFRLIQAMEYELSQHGYHLMIINAREDSEKELESIRLLSSGITDGIIIDSILPDCKLIDDSLPNDYPIVFIDRSLDHCAHDAIFISCYTGIFHGVNALINKGHTKIGLIAGIKHISTSIERLSAYKDALIGNGFKICNDYIKFEDDPGTVEEKAEELINDGCTAILVANTALTYTVTSWLIKNNLTDKVAILGYHDDINDVPFMQSIDFVGLISRPAEIMGKEAASQMLERINNYSAPTKILTIQSELHLY